MRPLSSQFPPDALTTLEAFMKQAKKTRVFRRAQAVRQVVAGHTVKATADTFHFTNSALRKWVKRFTREGTQGLLDRPRPGRPRTVTEEVEACIHRLFEQDPLAQGARSSQWHCRELSQAVSKQSGVSVGPERVRVALKKRAKLLPPHRQARP
jgi:transposase